MFLDLFYGLRDEGVPVAIQEWQAFLSALEQGLHGADLLRFSDYRTDRTLDIRQMRVALRRLRQLTRTGLASELDLDETVDETCRNAGEIELVFRPPRKNDVRLLLLMDVGGTMDPYVEPMSQLLTALHDERGLRAFEPYYFHNC